VSRAFVKEDSDGAAPRYSLPPRDHSGFLLAAARALLAGANQGDTGSAEEATGIPWGDPRLVPAMRTLLGEATERDDDRTVTLVARYLKAAGPGQ
jgi:hypothetical protein